jgi:hypothetical protein
MRGSTRQVGPGIAGTAWTATLDILHMGCTGSEACRCCSTGEAEAVVDSMVDCSMHYTFAVAAVDVVGNAAGCAGRAGCIVGVCCHDASPALPADDGCSSCRRGGSLPNRLGMSRRPGCL